MADTQNPKPGQPLAPGSVLTAEWLNALREGLQRARIIVGDGGGLTMEEAPGGTTLGLATDAGMWIKITGAVSGTAYPWTQQLEAASGGWTDGTLTGTTSSDPAYEINGNTTVSTGTIVRAWRGEQTQDLRFHASTC